MKRAILACFAGGAVLGVVLAYQAAARERDYRAYLARGDVALVGDETFAAIESYSGAVALRPDAMLAHLRRGEAYRRRADASRADLEAAARDFRVAATLDGTATRPLEELGDVQYQLQRYDRAAETYERCFQLDDRSARVAYKLALARYRGANLEGALTSINSAVRLDDTVAEAYYVLGVCLRDARRLSEAGRAFERAVSLSPGLIPAREELADVYGARGQRSDELEQLLLIAALDRGHPERQVAVGLAHARAGHPELAVVTLGTALERAPHDQPLIYRALGQVWLDIAEASQDRVALSKALEALERVASSPTASSEGLALYGRALLLDDEFDVAERTLEDAITRYPVDPAAFVLYADAAERSNHLEAARQALINHIALVGEGRDFVACAQRIGTLSLRLNDADAAVDWLQKAFKAQPTDIKTLALLAESQLRAGDLEGARATTQRGMSRDPANPTFLALSRRLKR